MSADVSRIPMLDSSQDDRLLDKLPPLRNLPRLAIEELREAAAVFEVLPDVEYPIISFTDLLEKLGGPDATISIVGVRFRPADMEGRISASYFPIGSSDDFVAKVGELLLRNRKKFPDPFQELERIRQVLPRFAFPIADREALRRMLGDSRIPFGRAARTADQIAEAVPDDYFPIASEEDLDRKALRLMQKRPLIEPRHE